MALSQYGAVLLLGGSTASTGSSASRSVYELDDPSGTWATAANLDSARSGGGVGQTGSYGPIVSGGGESGYRYSTDIFVYGGTPATSSVENYGWSSSEGSVNGVSMTIARSAFAYATDASTGDLYAIGGLSSSGVPLASAERYDPATDSWSAVAPLPQALYASSGAADGFGHIFVFAGAHATTGAASSSVYRYTIATNTWDTVASMPVAVRDGSAIDAPDGMIYFAGGKSTSGAIANVESFNPGADTWNTETPLPAALSGAALAIDSSDNLDVIGGFNSAGIATSNVYTTPITPGLAMPYTPTISFDDAWYTYDGQPHGVIASVLGTDGATPVDGTLDFTYDGSSTEPTNAGTYEVLATFTSNDSDYLSTVVAGQLEIDPATPTITVSGGGTITYDGQAHPISATAAGVDGATSVLGTFAYSYNNSASAPVNPGSYTAVADFTSGDSNYTNASASTNITIPDPSIPTGVTAAGASTGSIRVSWNPVTYAPVTYNVYERRVSHSPKGSLVTVYYVAVATGVTGTSVDIPVSTAFPGSVGHTYYVTSVNTATGQESVRSAPASASALYAPDLYGAMTTTGAVISLLYAPVGQPIQIDLLSYANEAATYSVQNAPATMSINSSSGLVTYVPSMSEAGTTVQPTFVATNSVGASSYSTFSFVVVLPADSNYDGQVDTSDFSTMAQHFGQANVGFAQGDFNGDGKVNALDFNVLASSFGEATGATTAAVTSAPAASSAVGSLFSSATVRPLAEDLFN
jgi:hypothetical protein